MGVAMSRELLSSLQALKRQVGPVSTSADAEPWWPLALSIDASLGLEETVGPPERQASHALLWAVSDCIRTLRRAQAPDVERVNAALAGLEGTLALALAPGRAGDASA